MIPYGHQSVDEHDVQAVVDVLRGDWLTQGPAVERFEQALAEKVEARHAVAFSSGTAALHGAAHAAGLGSEDLVVTSPLTFIASANCARYVGARVGLVRHRPRHLEHRSDGGAGARDRRRAGALRRPPPWSSQAGTSARVW